MTQKNPALLSEALYSKSQIYIKRGFRAKLANDLEEYQLWASLALELLGKSTLSSVHPALVADPNNFNSLLAACGRQMSPDIRTITAKTLFERLGHVIKNFDGKLQKSCEQMAIRRNAELHSGESPFSGILPDYWEKTFWYSSLILLSSQDKNLEEWLGSEDAKTPIHLVEEAKNAIKWAVSARIDKAKEEFMKANPNEEKRNKLILESEKIHVWQYHDKFNLHIDNYDSFECPSCMSKGVIGGITWSEDILDSDDFEDQMTETVQTTYLSDEFFCPTCTLYLSGKQEIETAELPDEFYETNTREREFEQEYGNE